MKNFLLFLALGPALLAGCEPKPISESNEPVSAKTEATLDSARQQELRRAKDGKAGAVYECPMNCEGSRSTQPGQCPVCGMDLEKKS